MLNPFLKLFFPPILAFSCLFFLFLPFCFFFFFRESYLHARYRFWYVGKTWTASGSWQFSPFDNHLPFSTSPPCALLSNLSATFHRSWPFAARTSHPFLENSFVRSISRFIPLPFSQENSWKEPRQIFAFEENAKISRFRSINLKLQWNYFFLFLFFHHAHLSRGYFLSFYILVVSRYLESFGNNIIEQRATCKISRFLRMHEATNSRRRDSLRIPSSPFLPHGCCCIVFVYACSWMGTCTSTMHSKQRSWLVAAVNRKSR